MTTYHVTRTTSPRDANRHIARPPLHVGDAFSGHPLEGMPGWVVLVEQGRPDVYVRASACEEAAATAKRG